MFARTAFTSLLLNCACACSLSAATHHVSKTGDADFNAIQSVIDAAQPGTTIQIAKGVYRENIRFAKSVKLVGAGMGKTIVELPGDTPPTMEEHWEQVIKRLENLSMEELRGEARKLQSKPSQPPLIISGDHDVRLEGIEFVWVGPKSVDNEAVEHLVDFSDVDMIVRDCAFIGSPEDGIRVRGGASIDMERCLVAGHWGKGIDIGDREIPTPRVRIVDCEIRNNYQSHIQLYFNVLEARIERNLLHKSAFFAIRSGGTNTVISGNALFNNARSAIYAGKGGVTITNNLFHENQSGGVGCLSGNTDLIAGNTFVRNGGEWWSFGVSCSRDAKPKVRNNIFVGQAYAIQSTYSSRDSRTNAAVGNPIIGRNLYVQNGTNVVRFEPIPDKEEGSRTIVFNLAEDKAPKFDPGFEDAAAKRFSLKRDSMARAQNLGAATALVPQARYLLHEREKAIIPLGDSMDFKQWRKPPNPDSKKFVERLYAIFGRAELASKRPKVSNLEAFKDLHAELGRRYPNFKLKRIDWDAVGKELIPRAEKAKDDTEFGLLCYELVARLEDSHAYVGKGLLEPPTYEFPRWDPGLACLMDDRGKPVVYYIDADGPAEKAGVKIGMTVVSVNGRPAADVIEETMRQSARYSGYSSERYLRYQVARWFVRQVEKDAMVKLEIETNDGGRKTFDLPATKAVRYLPRRPVAHPGIRDSANVGWAMLDDEIGLIYVRRIRSDLIAQLDKAVAEMNDAKGLIIDVRGNSGGGFDFYRSHRNFTADTTEEPERPRFTGPMALLIDSRCISAGEGWSSWFIANKRARVFGTATAGASARKTTYELKNKLYKVTFPVKPYKGYLDRIIERKGLEPDVEIRQNARDLVEGKDTVLMAAAKWLREQ